MAAGDGRGGGGSRDGLGSGQVICHYESERRGPERNDVSRVGVFIMHTVQIHDHENILQHEYTYVNIHNLVIVVRVAFCAEQNVNVNIIHMYMIFFFYINIRYTTYRYRYAPREYRILLVPFEVAPAEVRIGRTYI